MKKMTIGILGGMGTYATIHAFKQYAQIFQAEKEWDRPRILIDNRCTMPSRVRAFLFHENEDTLIREITESLFLLKKAGCNKIILACNTSHLFLPKIYEANPTLEASVVNIIDACVEKITQDGQRSVHLLASEGTIESNIYQLKLKEKNINVSTPRQKDYIKIRYCIESVKQNLFTKETKEYFAELTDKYDTIILGCTELPILYERCYDVIKNKRIYDPIEITLKKIKKEYDNQ